MQSILNATGITHFKKPFQGSTDTSTVSEASPTNDGETEAKAAANANDKNDYENCIDNRR